MAVADGFDAMTTDRPYQKGKNTAAALKIVRTHAGTKWDAACVAALEKVLAVPETDGDRETSE
jgi:HD-GYP domain-containing protein (c-di-GMP phosphodiesterase class II)